MKYPGIKKITRKLRNDSTAALVKLWKYLRRRQIEGRSFLRQYAIIYESIRNEHFFYVPDFYCYKEKLAIELDGKIHDFTQKRDSKRDEILNHLGITVLRIKNEELQDVERILNKKRI